MTARFYFYGVELDYKMSYLYRHIRIDKNVPFYIGIGSDETYKRAIGTNPRSRFWKAIVNKSDYEVEIMLDDLTWEEACEKEKEFIKLYGRRNINSGTLVNLTDGGEGNIGMIVSDETKAKKSKSMKHNYDSGKMIITEERRLKMSESMKMQFANGRRVQNKGTHLSDEHKRKVSIGRAGIGHTEQTKKKISEIQNLQYESGERVAAWNGKKFSDEHKRKIGEAGVGRIISDETRLKRSIAQKNRVYIPGTRTTSGMKWKTHSAETKLKMSFAHNARKTDAEIISIRSMGENGFTYAQIGIMYNCNKCTIGRIVRRIMYKHI